MLDAQLKEEGPGNMRETTLLCALPGPYVSQMGRRMEQTGAGLQGGVSLFSPKFRGGTWMRAWIYLPTCLNSCRLVGHSGVPFSLLAYNVN